MEYHQSGHDDDHGDDDGDGAYVGDDDVNGGDDDGGEDDNYGYGGDDNPIKDLNTSQQAFKARIAECEQAEMNLKSKLTMTLKEIKVLDFRFCNVTFRMLVFKAIRT